MWIFVIFVWFKFLKLGRIEMLRFVVIKFVIVVVFLFLNIMFGVILICLNIWFIVIWRVKFFFIKIKGLWVILFKVIFWWVVNIWCLGKNKKSFFFYKGFYIIFDLIGKEVSK